MEADLPPIFLRAHQAINLLWAEQMAMLGIAETALRAMKLPIGLSDHGGDRPTSNRQLGSGVQVAQGEWM